MQRLFKINGLEQVFIIITIKKDVKRNTKKESIIVPPLSVKL